MGLVEIRVRCSTCAEVYPAADLLRAQSPFDESDTVEGCPKCLSVFSDADMIMLCQHEDCTRAYSVGRPTPDGYRHLCYFHHLAIPEGD